MQQNGNYLCSIIIKDKRCNVDNVEYLYGPTNDKEFDLISTPVTFLERFLEKYDGQDIEEIMINIRK